MGPISQFENYQFWVVWLGLNLRWLFDAKAIFVVEHYRGGNKGFHTYPEGIISKVNAIARLEFEYAYYEVAVQHVSHYATKIPPSMKI